MSQLDSNAFRRALGNFATGVTIVTAQDNDGNKVGVTANSFNSVSLDPALILWSIDKRSSSKEIFLKASHFAVNVLASDQISISNHFARPSDDKFANIAHQEGRGGALLFADTAAHFECELYQVIEGGDHLILLGKVVDFKDRGRAPLLYHQGVYAVALPHSGLDIKESDLPQQPISTATKHLHDNMNYLLTQAVRVYQREYYPKQQTVGLTVSEARLIMVLYSGKASVREAMLQEIAMPMREIDIAIEGLTQNQFLQSKDGHLHLTVEGVKKAEQLVTIASKHQDEVFEAYSAEEIAILKRILQGLIDRAK